MRGDGEREEPEPEPEGDDDVLGERRRLELLDLPLDDFFFVSREDERDLDRDLLLDFPLVDLFLVSREDERDPDLDRDLLDLVLASMEGDLDLER